MDVLTPYLLEEALEVRFTHPEATPAIVAALRAATGRVLNRVPVTPDDLLGLREPAATTGRAPIPDVPGQQAIPEYLGLGLGQQELMKAR